MRLVRSIFVVALLAGVVFVPSASALAFTDQSYLPPEGIVGTPYAHTFGARGGCAPYTFTVINGALPPGLTLEASTGKVSGTPTTPGSYSFWVDLADKPTGGTCVQTHAQREFGISIIAKLTVTNETAPAGTAGTPYSLQLTAAGGGTQTWSIQSGVLPPGLTFDPKTALLAGTPTTPGSYSFVVLVTDPKRSDTKALTIEVRAPLAAPAALFAATGPDAEVGVPFGARLTPTGGSGVFTWTLAAGALPPGVSLDPTGAIGGVPTEAGSFPYQLTVTDSEGRTASFVDRVTVAARLEVRTRLIRPAKAGREYSTTLRTHGGIGPVTWRTMGPVPRGIHVDRETGELSGVPAKPGRYRIKVRATDARRVVATKTLVLTVNA